MDPRIYKAVQWIEDRYKSGFSIDKLASTLNLSPSHLRHLFKDETGVSPTKYLKSFRLKKAKELLETTFLHVKEVMLQVGMNDVSHFVRDFKQAYGRPPAMYRTFYLRKIQRERKNR